MVELDIPDKCRGCGVQEEIITGIANAKLAQYRSNDIAISLMGGTGELLEQIKQAAPDQQAAEELTKELRDNVVRDLDIQDKIITGYVQESQEHSDACDGLLTTESVYKGRCYKIGVCTSALLYEPGQQTTSTAVVEVRDIEE